MPRQNGNQLATNCKVSPELERVIRIGVDIHPTQSGPGLKDQRIGPKHITWAKSLPLLGAFVWKMPRGQVYCSWSLDPEAERG